MLPENKITNELKNGLLVKFEQDDVKTKFALDYYAVKLKSQVLGAVANQLWNSLLMVDKFCRVLISP